MSDYGTAVSSQVLCVEKQRNLWIGAICVHQTDYTELSQQVPRMGEIYRLAYTETARGLHGWVSKGTKALMLLTR